MFCLVRVSFFTDLVVTTASLMLVLVASCAVARAWPRSRRLAIKVAVYVLLFAYPVVSTKIVQAFSCHDVGGTASYLRADYSVECYSSRWYAFVGYASFLLVVYVVAMPLLILVGW